MYQGPASARSRRRAATAFIGAALAVVGCGSSTTSTAQVSGTTASGSTVAAAQARLQTEETRPTTIGLTTPINGTVPAGKKVAFISCGAAGCDAQAPVIQQAAGDLGWTATTISTNGSPAQVQNAIETAIRQGADVVVLDAVNRASVATQIGEMQAKGIAFVTCCSTDPVGNGILFNTSTSDQNTGIGQDIADLITADSGGKANTLYVNISAFAILQSLGDALKQAYTQECPGCGYDTIDIPLTALGKDVSDRIVSYLRAHPSVNYVALSTSESLVAGLPAALSAAGLVDKVKIVGQGGNTTVFQYIANGQMLGTVPFDFFTVDYLMLDAAVRNFTGQTIAMTPPPHWVVTKDNLPTATQLFPVVADYRTQFMKLWGKA